MNVAVELEQRAVVHHWCQRPAYRSAGGRAVTHGEVHQRSAQVAAVLAHHGVRPGDRVLLRSSDRPEWVQVFLGALRLGAVPVAAPPVATEPERRRVEADCRPAMVVVDPGDPGSADVATMSVDDLARAAELELPPAPVDAGPGSYVQYTSGTTGEPRGAVHSGADLAHHHVAVGEHVLGLLPDDVSLSVSKLFFTYGFGNSLIYPLFSGSSAILLAHRPGPEELAELVARHRVTVVHGVPSAWAGLLAAFGREPAPWATDIRVAVSAGERLPTALAADVESLLGAPLLDELGSTELGGACCAQTPSQRRPGTLGPPLPGFAVEVRDDTGERVLPEGAVGELWVSGPTLTSGYLGDTGRSPALRGGWLRTGDLAAVEPDGHVRHAGRRDDVQLVGGIKVAPDEVEATLLRHDAVVEAGVVAVPDATGATRLRAAVVPAPHAVDRVGPALESELLTGMRRELAPFKVPRSVRFLPELPRTGSGKLRRHLLVAEVT